MRRAVILTILVAMGAATLAGLVAACSYGEPAAAEMALVEPERTAPEPARVAPRAVPPAADAVPPLAFTLRTTWTTREGSRSTTQHIVRTRDCARLVLEGGLREWLFVRNPVYRERVSGGLIDHDARSILDHQDSELQTLLEIGGWADVLMLRFDPAVLAGMRDTGERREAAGAVFHRFVAPPETTSGVSEVWWSEPWLLPLATTRHDPSGATVRTEVVGLTTTVDPSALADASVRFPDYEALDAVDARDYR